MTDNISDNNTQPPADTPADRAAADATARSASLPSHTAHTLNPDDAVSRAAEQAKTTSSRNLPTFGDLPVDEDTANLRLGPNLDDALLALLPLVGVWRGTGEAVGDSGEYRFGQQIVFAHDGGDYLSYSSTIWRLDEDDTPAGLDQREVGFMRISASDEIEMTVTNSGGVVEIYYGEPLNERAWQLESALTTVTTSGPATLGPGKRLYGLLPTNDLGWVEERVVDGALTPYKSAQLQRFAG